MTIYLEYAIVDNIVINLVLLCFVFWNVKNKLAAWKLTICIAVGMVFACVVPLASIGLLTAINPRNFYIAITILMAAKVFVTCVFLFFMSALIKFLNLRGALNNHLCDIVITYKGKEYKTRAYLDTGNRLIDPESKAPVVIISKRLYLKMVPILSGHYISFSTVDKADGKMFVFKPNKFEIVTKDKKTQHENVRIGLAMRDFKDKIKYEALLNVNLAV
jgi:phosphatidylglycerophosphate synthase